MQRLLLPPLTGVRKGAHTGFTLVELLVVMAVLVVIAAFSLGLAGWVNGRVKTARTENQMHLLQVHLDRYATDNGLLFQGDDPSGLSVYRMLFGDGVGPDLLLGTADDEPVDCLSDEGASVYLADLDPHRNPLRMVKLGSAGRPVELVDPFGNSWRYRAGPGGGVINPDFDLWSPGPDGVDHTADDIHNW